MQARTIFTVVGCSAAISWAGLVSWAIWGSVGAYAGKESAFAVGLGFLCTLAYLSFRIVRRVL